MKPPYEITNKILKIYGEITEALGICQTLMLIKPEAKLRKQNRIKIIQSSLAIEGNTLNLENVTALIDNHRVLGPQKDILEVKNAIIAYDQLNNLNPFLISDFLKAHGLLMKNLIDNPGKFRTKQVGIMKGEDLTHFAPSAEMVKGLMNDLFTYVKKDKDLELIKSCVFHYEMEFIHPFEDGNGRIGRYWQTRILMDINPIFEYVPIEKLIQENQKEYYLALSNSDKTGKSTIFIEFMLDMINKALRNTIDDSKPQKPNYSKRIQYALTELNGWFTRKEYMTICKGISTATASRDLKKLLNDGIIEFKGEGRMTKYRKIKH
jgi:Fic family protein